MGTVSTWKWRVRVPRKWHICPECKIQELQTWWGFWAIQLQLMAVTSSVLTDFHSFAARNSIKFLIRLTIGAGMPARKKRQKATSSSSAATAAASGQTTPFCVKRSRTCFTVTQLTRLNDEFAASHYLTNSRRCQLAEQLLVSELQVKIWFQNQRAKLKRSARATANTSRVAQ